MNYFSFLFVILFSNAFSQYLPKGGGNLISSPFIIQTISDFKMKLDSLPYVYKIINYSKIVTFLGLYTTYSIEFLKRCEGKGKKMLKDKIFYRGQLCQN